MGKWKGSPTTPPKAGEASPLQQQEQVLASEIGREETRLEALAAAAEQLTGSVPYVPPYYPPGVQPEPVPPTPESVCLEYEKHVYVTSDNVLKVLDPLTGAVENTADMGAGSFDYDFFTFDPATGHVYANGEYGVSDVQVFDIMGNPLYNLSLSAGNDKEYYWFSADPDRHLMYMYDWGAQTIDILDTETDELIDSVYSPTTIVAQVLDPATGDMYLVGDVDGNDGQILRIDGVTHELSVLFTTPMDLDWFAAAAFVYDRKIYITPVSPEGLYVYDVDADTWTELIDDEIYYPVYDEVKQRIYMMRGDEVHVYDLKTGGYYMVDDYPDGGGFNGDARAYDPDTQILYIVDDNGEVVAYDTNTWQKKFVTPPLDLDIPQLVIGKYCTKWS
jgi:DNA-binding beta-propeller fold protein YncE